MTFGQTQYKCCPAYETFSSKEAFEQKCHESNFFQFSLLPSLISGPLEY